MGFRFGFGSGLKPKPNPKKQKFLGFKNILFLLRYFNEYIFSDFLKTQIFSQILGSDLGLVLGFFGSLGMDMVSTQTQRRKETKFQTQNPNPTKLERNRLTHTKFHLQYFNFISSYYFKFSIQLSFLNCDSGSTYRINYS
jgi:hypothetical protein